MELCVENNFSPIILAVFLFLCAPDVHYVIWFVIFVSPAMHFCQASVLNLLKAIGLKLRARLCCTYHNVCSLKMGVVQWEQSFLNVRLRYCVEGKKYRCKEVQQSTI